MKELLRKILLMVKCTLNVKQVRGLSLSKFLKVSTFIFLYIYYFYKWIEFMDEFCRKHGIKEIPSFLVTTPTRPYSSANIKISERLRLLKDHYNIFGSYLNDNALRSLLEDNKCLKLAVLEGKNDSKYSFNITNIQAYMAEGELSLFMQDDEGDVRLTTITLAIGKKEGGKNYMRLGGLQGPLPPLGKERVVKSTRDLNGLRPKFAVIEGIYAVAEFFNADEIIATSLANHPTFRYMSKKKITGFFSDYDGFWQELGGVLDKDGNFALPKTLPKRTLEEVPSKKKKDWLKRQAYIEQIKANAAESLKQVCVK